MDRSKVALSCIVVVALAMAPVVRAQDPAMTPAEVSERFKALDAKPARPYGAKGLTIPKSETHDVLPVTREDLADVAAGKSIRARNITPTPRKRDQAAEKVEILIQFKINSYELLGAATQMLDEVAKYMKGHEGARLAVNGHTDSKTGTLDHNLQLSKMRAASVLNYLVEKAGVERERFEGNGYGPNAPKFPEDTPEGIEKNRRVEFEVLKKN